MASGKKKRYGVREATAGICMACLPIAGFLLFTLIPILLALSMAFLDLHELYTFEAVTWDGLENFKEVLTDPVFWRSVGNTFYLAAAFPVNIVLSLLIAYLLSKNIGGKKIFRCIFFIPYVCSTVAVMFMWSWIFNEQYGVVNHIFGLTGEKSFNWFSDEMFIPTMLLTGIWSGTGFGIILYSAALTNINSSLYEAAKLDGANAVTIFFRVTFPLVSPTTFYLIITMLIGALQEFTRSQVLVGDALKGKTIMLYLWEKAFRYPYDVGLASATSWLLALLLVGITVLNFKVSKKWVYYD